MQILIVDRVENSMAVLEKEDLSHITVSIDEIGFNVRQGNVLEYIGGKYYLNEEKELDRKRKIAALQKKVFEKSNKT